VGQARARRQDPQAEEGQLEVHCPAAHQVIKDYVSLAQKGPFTDPKLIKKISKLKAGDKTPVKTWSRASVIMPEFVGFVFGVHNGKIHVPVSVVENMVGHRLGEFASTRKFLRHGGKLIKDTGAAPSPAPPRLAPPPPLRLRNNRLWKSKPTSATSVCRPARSARDRPDPRLARRSGARPALLLTKAAARPVKKLLESAIANATHNFKLSREGLYVQAIFANQGPTLKRWRPRAMGSAAPILKRSCHVTIVLGQHEVPKVAKPVVAKGEKPATKSAPAEKPAAKKAVKKPAPTAKPAAKAAKKAVKK